MLHPGHIFAALLLLSHPHAASTAPLAEKYTSGTSYYFSDFNPGQQPWEPGQHLNIEEVFKNYQYYEIIFDQDGKSITVNHYLRGSKASSEKYLILPDNTLRQR